MEIKAVPDEDWTEDVIDRANHEDTPEREEQDVAPLAFRGEEEGGGVKEGHFC